MGVSDLFQKAKRLKDAAMQDYYNGRYDKAVKNLEEAKTLVQTLKHSATRKELIDVYEKVEKHYDSLIKKISTDKKVATIKSEIANKPVKRSISDEKCNQFVVEIGSNKNFSNIAGLEEVKQQLRESIEYPLKYPELVEKYSFTISNGILLYGPPGCGKTFIIACAGGEFDIPIFKISGSTVLSKYVGESPKHIRNVYECAEKNAPAIVFIDEIDKFITNRDTSGVIMQIQSELQQYMSGLNSVHNVITVGATNCPWDLDPALIRRGRMGIIIYVPPPNTEIRKELFNIYLKSVENSIENDITIDELAELTESRNGWYYSCSDIATICDEVKKEALRKEIAGHENVKITRTMLVNAISNIEPSISPTQIQKYQKWKNRVQHQL